MKYNIVNVNNWDGLLNEEAKAKRFKKENPKLAKMIEKATVYHVKKCAKMTTKETMEYLNEIANPKNQKTMNTPSSSNFVSKTGKTYYYDHKKHKVFRKDADGKVHELTSERMKKYFKK